jgi:hypothetical protein
MASGPLVSENVTVTADEALAVRTRKRVTRRLIPFLA